MKTATVTWTTYNNYGTILQAYALQQELYKLGFSNKIICDEKIIAAQFARNKSGQKKIIPTRKKEKQTEFNIQRITNLIFSPRKVRRVLLARLDRERYVRPFYASQEGIQQFKRDYLVMDRDVSPDSLVKLNERYDVFIAGSDQIWSVFERDFNTFYYLDFATKRKVAYAPCLGTDQISDSMKEEIKKLLSSFYALSVREDTTSQQLTKICGQSVEWVADPTFFLNREEWARLIQDVIFPVKGRYLLCYFIENQPWYFEKVKIIARKSHLRPVLIPNKWEFLSNEYVLDDVIGPKEFVALFFNAEYVLTDSYHGSIFSMLFEKGFLYLQRFREDDPKSQNIRVHSLFRYFSCEDRIITKENHKQTIAALNPEISKKISILRKHSHNFLIESLK